ncbi:hypothetical protein EH228_06175 [Erwinia endophytica]|uniref:hypothetical protein n=1 Tax=Erwinia endophytica TaxID=1563158 RepID=UPI001265E719|nr:hypothetical protein [Erwinia endophytica]KAB8312660.1 hypothetical protein EH228_06175 [Erwinia endophytica]
MRYLFVFLLSFSISSYANDDLGEWGTTCDDDGFYFPLEQKISPLVVNDNQIVISIHSSVVNNGVIDVYLDGPLDLGSGGMNIKWDDVDKTKKIAEFNYKNETGYLKWFGFFDKKKKKYFWSKDPDFVRTYSYDGAVKMKKCE